MSGLERYRIVREIGRGAMGVVHLAHDEETDTDVALKELLIPTGASAEKTAETLERFRREAEAAASIDQPNIVKVLGSLTEDDRQFIVMEYLEGETLDAVLQRGPLPPAAAIGATTQILEALKAAHEKGIVHRDLKPQNIFVLGDGLVKVADFGVAHIEEESGLTVAGQILGTIGYMSPEQLSEGKVDARTDVFAVGVMLYEMLAGTNPFGADQPGTSMYRIAFHEPAALDAFVADMPAFLTPVMQKAMSKDPGLRYQSAEEMAGDLESEIAPDVSAIVAAAEERAAAQEAAKNQAAAPAPKPKIKLPFKPAVLAAVLVGVALLVGGYAFAQSSAKNKAAEAVARKTLVIAEAKRAAATVDELKGVRDELDAVVAAVKSKASSNESARSRWSSEWSSRKSKYNASKAAAISYNQNEDALYESSYTSTQMWNGYYYVTSSEYTYTPRYRKLPKAPKKPAKVKVSLGTENSRLAALQDRVSALRSRVASETPSSRFFGPVYQIAGVAATAADDSVREARSAMSGIVTYDQRGAKVDAGPISAVSVDKLDTSYQQLDQQLGNSLGVAQLTLAEVRAPAK